MAEKRVETLQIKGMARHVNEINAEQGTTQELINAKPWNGAIVPVQDKKMINNIDSGYAQIMHNLEDITVHVVQGTGGNTLRYFWTYSNADYDHNIFRWYEESSNLNNVLQLEEGEDFISITTLNNIVIVSTTERKVYFLFKDGAYEMLPELFFPDVWIQPQKRYERSANGTTKEEIVGNTIKRREESLKKDNLVHGYMFMRMALKLYDGSYIQYTAPFFVQCYASTNNNYNPKIQYSTGQRKDNGDVENQDEYTVYKEANNNTYYAIMIMYRLVYKFEISAAKQDILKKYKGIITSVDIFSTRIFNPHNIEKLEELPYNDEEIYTFPSSDNTIKDNFERTGNYHKIAEIELNKLIENNSGSEVIDFKKEITSNPLLEVDNFTNHIISGKRTINYNSRIHFANTIQVLGKTYWNHPRYYDWTYQFQSYLNEDEFTITRYEYENDTNTGTRYKVLAKIELDTFEGIKTVIHDVTETVQVSFNEDSGRWFSTDETRRMTLMHLDSIISYPDSRATKIIYYLYNTETDEAIKIHSFDLQGHDFLNIAYHLNTNSYLFENTYAGMSEDSNDEPSHFYFARVQDWTLNKTLGGVNKPIITDISDDKVISDKNRIQLSELDNPFVYPAENSYQIGTQADEIVAIGTSVEAISEGQFGMFPLYVFTKQGIWLMQQGNTAGIQYSNIVPVSRIRARGKNVASTKQGLVFISEEGVHIVAGREIVNISRTLRNFDYDFKLTSGGDYGEILADSPLSGLIDADTFLDYISSENTAVVYDTVKEEIYVSNNNYNYSYVFQFNSQTWYKTGFTFEHVVSQEPGYIVSNDVYFYDIEKDRTISLPYYKNILIQTNPLTLNSMWKKKLARIVIRCNIMNKIANEVTLRVLASNNLNEWNEVNRIADYDEEIHDMKMKRLRASYKYFVFIIEGNIKVNHSDITVIQTEVEDRFTNKLR